MNTEQLIDQFLKQKRIAVAGISRNPQGAVGNLVYKKFKNAGYEVFAINPKADEIEGEKCYRTLKDVPGKPDAVFLSTHPDQSLNVVKECAGLGIKNVWFHRSFGKGSYNEAAEKFCRDNGIDPIIYGCPMMYIAPVDFGHKCIRFFMKVGGKLK
ncbi:MAG TPA: CoA-binding protein [Melioribacteraceae bacterium]|nr:CoA-binding protein [Melioribacteraceae bacterium]